MGARCVMRSVAVMAAVMSLLGVVAGGASAASLSLCVLSTAGQTVASGACSGPATTVALPARSDDQQTLISILPHISFSSSGVGGQPTVIFSGVNVQVVSGSGATNGTLNGAGNLVIGYAENPSGRTRTGSNDLVLGTDNGWSGYGQLVAGDGNTTDRADRRLQRVGIGIRHRRQEQPRQ